MTAESYDSQPEPKIEIPILIKTARSFSSFNDARSRLIGRLANLKHEQATPLTNHLAQKLLGLRGTWTSIDFREQDWKNLEKVSRFSLTASQALNDLLVQYIRANAVRVNRIVQFEHDISNEALDGGVDLSAYESLSLDDIDRQSLFMFRVKGASYAADHTTLLASIQDERNSHWLRRRFLYPFVYHSVNLPTEAYLDTFLSYVVPEDAHEGLERRVMRHLLRDDLSVDYKFAFKTYIALMCHPFDALEALNTHVEIEIARDGQPSTESFRLYNSLGSDFPRSRIHDLFERFRDIIDSARLEDRLMETSRGVSGVSQQVKRYINAFVTPDSTMPAGPFPIPEWGALLRMRWSRYPDVEDFESATLFGRLWWFLNAGRLFTSLCTSMYMLPRRAAVYEKRELNRLVLMTGVINSYILAAPRGDELLRTASFAGQSDIEDVVSAILDQRLEAQDRTWFHRIHWRLRKPRAAVRVREWLSIARSAFPVAPSFLTGIDWTWIDEVLPSVRIAPFSDTPDGPYVLLLRDIEEHKKDTTILRTAIEHHSALKTCESFVEWLIEEYHEWSVAFVRFFLTPENIMLMELAPNMMAALSDRIAALQACASRFEFGTLLTEQQMQQELQTLTSALMLLNVNANQFEVPWERFRQDVAERQRDSFNAYKAMRNAEVVAGSLDDGRALYVHRYSNGQVVHYSMRRSLAPASLLLLGIIDAFLDHPSYGIEAILSTRFRHDTLRREFVTTFQTLKNSSMPGIVLQEKNRIIDILSAEFLNSLDEWLTLRMQTKRPGFDSALFDFTLPQDSISSLAERVEDLSSLDDVCEVMIERLSSNLEAQLVVARQSFVEDFKPVGIRVLNQAAVNIPADLYIGEAIVDRVALAVKSSLERRVDDLVEWLRTPGSTGQRALTFKEITYAVIGRFEHFVAQGSLRVLLKECWEAESEVGAEKVRLYFDLLSEVVQNCTKYCGVEQAQLRIRPFRSGDDWGFVYSSFAEKGEAWIRGIEGHPYRSLSDSLFREGNSGLAKISAIAASIAGKNITVMVERRVRSFHVKIPVVLGSGV